MVDSNQVFEDTELFHPIRINIPYNRNAELLLSMKYY